MSFLVSPNDPQMLAEALAFVDGFDFDNNTDETSGSSDSGVIPVVESHKRRHSAAKGGKDSATPPDKQEKAKGRRKNAVYSARLRAKKKNEMQTLKEQVTQLQMQLHRLKSASSTALTGKDHSRLLPSASRRTGSSFWLQEATAQAYQRHQSELLNVQLKTLLAKVVKKSRTMQSAFQNLQSLGCDINMAVGAPSTILAGTSLRSNDATSQLGELRERLDQMYASAHDVLAVSGTGAVEVASFVSQIKRDPVSGRKLVQLSSSTPLMSDLDAASRMIWQGMQLKGSKCCKYHVHRLHVNASSIAKSFFLTLSDDPTPCTLHGAALVRKFEERDRILYIWTTAMVPSRKESGGKSRMLRVREKGWTMLSRSAKNPEQESVFHTCYEVSSELGDIGQAEAEIGFDDNYGRIGNGVVNLLSNDLRKFHERVQDKLLAAEAP
ncbi:hypothetical protein PHYPSEUDO_013590 [Phytophthora pseudosyringae]|uniref:BZIP domain-containing protein n=1 Tax=Phytophthora pseudosyringae TaxID=221518 RepID=A0A8T1V584_9STRA|nr:hypothetical protein PHYPSEUDO_013590 [Phytophthora pseudosyringae]